MVELPACPSFAEFYGAVHDRPPLRWQERLAAEVAREGWPAEIGVPTGLGKTSALDIAVWSLARQADLPPSQRTAPTRLWYVVDRRLLVDAASAHAERLADLLAEVVGSSPLARVAARLRHVGGGLGRPLHASGLRGGAALGARPLTPAQPAILCATVAMYGSRLLFRGFGASNRMWPIDAALAGTDALVVLDEAHLAEPLLDLLDQLDEVDAHRARILRSPSAELSGEGSASLLCSDRRRPVLVALTATGRAEDPFRLDDDDLGDEIVRERLDAAKPTELVEGSAKRLPSDLAAHAVRLLRGLGRPGAAVVFVNAPRTARSVASHLPAGEVDVVILTGQLREPDAAAVRERLLRPELGGCAAGTEGERERPLVVVATQTLEVGADLDFDVCVSEMAGVRALTQRWGRLNRLGRKPHARGLLYFPVDAGDTGLYRSEPRRLWERLTGGGEREIQLHPRVVNHVLALDEPDERSSVVPALLPNHLWEYAKTSVPPAGGAPPELFFAGMEEASASVSVLWRAVVPVAGSSGAGSREDARTAVDHAVLHPPVSSGEVVDVPIGDLRRFAEARPLDQVLRLRPDGVTVEEVSVSGPPGGAALRPGDRVVLRAGEGGYRGGWDPDATGEVRDLSPFERRVLHLDDGAVANLLGAPLLDEEGEVLQMEELLALDDDERPDRAEDDAVVARIAALVAEQGGEVAHRLWPSGPDAARLRLERVGDADERAVLVWDAPSGPSRQVRVDTLDELSIATGGDRAELAVHLGDVAALARRIAEALGLPEVWCRAVEEAGRWHDLGKAEWRFQRWLGADGGGVPLAKSNTDPRQWERRRVMAGWPRGGRHELLSVQLIDAALEAGTGCADADLVRHLVITHHGHGRPLVPVAGDDIAQQRTSVEVAGTTFAAATSAGRADWGQPERFRSLNERFGYWGLALLEAVVRQADHLASALPAGSAAARGGGEDRIDPQSPLEVQ